MMPGFDRLPRWLIWEIAVPLTLLNVWLLYKVFQAFQTPFTIVIIATLLSFLLNYPIVQLEKGGMVKAASIMLILLGAICLIGVVNIMLLPILLQQLGDLAANRLSNWLDSGSQEFQALDIWLTTKHIPLKATTLATLVAQLLPDQLDNLPEQALDLIGGVADRLVEILFIGVLTLYFLLYGDAFWNGLWGWLPENVGKQVSSAFQEQFRNYFIGQATIALLMAVVLTVLFFLLNIPYWLVFGMSIGLLALIPFGDMCGFAIAAIFVSFKSVILGGELILVSLVTDQIIDQVIAPKILGDLIGLNPIWILISLLLGAQIGGVLGVLLAVPLAGSIKRIFDSLLLPHMAE